MEAGAGEQNGYTITSYAALVGVENQAVSQMENVGVMHAVTLEMLSKITIIL
jgi:hypothetical protein